MHPGQALANTLDNGGLALLLVVGSLVGLVGLFVLFLYLRRAVVRGTEARFGVGTPASRALLGHHGSHNRPRS